MAYNFILQGCQFVSWFYSKLNIQKNINRVLCFNAQEIQLRSIFLIHVRENDPETKTDMILLHEHEKTSNWA